eukprot:g3050.t1
MNRSAATSGSTGGGRRGGGGGVALELPGCIFSVKSNYILKVYLLNGDYRSVKVTKRTTVGEVIMMIAKKMNIQDSEKKAKYFGLFRCQGATNVVCRQKWLPVSKDIVGILKTWDPDDTPIFQIKLFLDREIMVSRCIFVRYLVFIQTVNNILTGIYHVKKKDAIWLAGVLAQYRFGDYDEDVMSLDFYADHGLMDYLPVGLLNTSRRNLNAKKIESMNRKFAKDIRSAHQTMKEVSRKESLRKYLYYCKKYPFFGNTFFLTGVESKTKRFLKVGAQIKVGIGVGGVKIFRKSKKSSWSYSHLFVFSSINRWGFTQDGNFFMDVFIAPTYKNKERRTRHQYLVFQTTLGKDMAALLSSYVEELAKARSKSAESDKIVSPTPHEKRRQSISIANAEQSVLAEGTRERLDLTRSTRKIQALFRGYVLRNRVRQWRAAMTLQARWRGYQVRRSIQLLNRRMLIFLHNKGVKLDLSHIHGTRATKERAPEDRPLEGS